MKKIICLSMLFSAFAMYAQNREKGTIEVTPIIGFSSANYYSNESLSNSAVSSFDFGVNGDYYFNDRWSLRSGLLFQTMGSQYINFEDKLEYFTLPINANWHFGSTRKWNLNFGPSLGFLMSAKANGIDVKDEANSFQLGLSYGIGYKIEVSQKFSILIDFQGITGLTEVIKDTQIPIKNAYSAFNIGGVFKL
ncbi:porin family protein [Flavobacterium sp.]|uniref:porin family protein n=1 Tax=Flavobacterium sp. TaxID=239 RepID=UPI002FDAB720